MNDFLFSCCPIRKKAFRLQVISFLFLFSISGIAPAQTRLLDSLGRLLKAIPPSTGLKEDTTRMILMNKISRQELVTGNYDSALVLAKQVLKIGKGLPPQVRVKRCMASAYNNIGLVFYYRGSYPEGLREHLNALKLQEETGDQSGIAGSYNHIGLIQSNMGLHDDALKSHTSSLNIKKKLKDGIGICASYVNIGNIYSRMGNHPAALKNYYAGLEYSQGDRYTMATIYNNIGTTFIHQSNYDYALKNFFLALDTRKDLQDPHGEAMSFVNLADTYIRMKKYQEAERYATRSLKISEEIGALDLMQAAYDAFTVIYDSTGRKEKAYASYKSYVSARDSLNNKENTRKAVEQQMQFEFSRKMTADSILVAEEKRVSAASLKQAKTQRFALGGGLILVLIFAVFMVNRFRVTYLQKQIIEQKERETQRQNEIIADQRDQMNEKRKEILDSISYALRIQRSMLASDDLLNSCIGTTGDGSLTCNYFILYKPKDIVSGDFYWASKLSNGDFALAVADSTGHGVPGAIMSMLNIACLNESVSGQITRPDQILFETRKRVINYLKNDGSSEGGKDGMDCSLLTFNYNTNELCYAGANNPIWIIRRSELIEIIPDKMPIGRHARDSDPFTLHTVALEKGDLVYAFTDGYADQFGGPKGKKFMTKAFKELLLAISDKPLAEQKQLLNDAFEEWKAQLEQVDDVTVFGISVG